MKNLNLNQMEVLNGGVCVLIPGTGDCRPSICTGIATAFAASGNTHIPLIICIA